MNIFSNISGDNNPIHVDPEFASKTIFKGTIVHGIFTSSLFSILFGRSVPGSIYVSQDLHFKRPVHVGVPVKARIEVLASESKRKGDLVTCSTLCTLEDGGIAISGEAKVLLPTTSSN